MLDGFEPAGDGCSLDGTREGQRFRASARFVIDASGPRGFLTKLLRLPEARFEGFPETPGLRTSHINALIKVHDRMVAAMMGMENVLAGQQKFAEAVPHYEVYIRANPRDGNAWTGLGIALISLGRSADAVPAFRQAVTVDPRAVRGRRARRGTAPSPRVAFRTSVAGGPRWTMLPSAAAVIDPLFSTGIPLALLGVDRIGRAIREAWGRPEFEERMRVHERETLFEADAAARLVGAAYSCFGSFPHFVGIASCYLASVSFSEVCYRLGDRGRANGFLACRDENYARAFLEVVPDGAGADLGVLLPRHGPSRRWASPASDAPAQLVPNRLPSAARRRGEAQSRSCGIPPHPGDGSLARAFA